VLREVLRQVAEGLPVPPAPPAEAGPHPLT